MTDEQRALLDQIQTIIRNKHDPVEDLNGLKAGEVVEQVDARLDVSFNMHMHTQAWRFYKARPSNSATNESETKPDFCYYNATFEQYIYKPAWVEYLVRHLADPETFAAVRAWPNQPATETPLPTL